MGIVLRVLLVFVGLFVAFIVRQHISVRRGLRKRDSALLERLAPLREKLERGVAVDRKEITRLAAVAELRGPLHRLLTSHDLVSFFPRKYLTRDAQAAALLVYWMLHPHEMQAAPAVIKPVATLHRQVGAKRGEFRVLRYRMPAGHWAGQKWLLGLAGPFFEGEEPYNSVAGGFSRCSDVYGRVAPEALVDWYANLVQPQFRRAS